MAATIDRNGGTRVRLFPQAYMLDNDLGPATVVLNVPRGRVRPGPGDDRLYVVVAPTKTELYGRKADRFGRESFYGPPWTGPALPPARPDRDGNLDHIGPDDPAYLAVHAYACARLSLDVLEAYCGRVPWHFAETYARLEVICVPGQDNAFSGYGFIELGENTGQRRGQAQPYALNLDTVAHEIGHLVLLSRMGFAEALFDNPEFRAFHEAMADLAAFLVAAHVDAVLDRVLRATKGNLYVANELSRVVELSPADQIRNLGHGVTMASFRHGWSDEHDLSLPLGGAFFDIMVEVYQTLLVEAGVLGPEIIEVSDNIEAMLAFEHPIEAAFAEAYAADSAPFKAALIAARDVLGTLLAYLWRHADARGLTFADVAESTAIIERRLFGGRFARAVETSFAWRLIGEVAPGPHIEPLKPGRHSIRGRAASPAGRQRFV